MEQTGPFAVVSITTGNEVGSGTTVDDARSLANYIVTRHGPVEIVGPDGQVLARISNAATSGK